MANIIKHVRLEHVYATRHPLGPRVLALANHLAGGGTVPPIHVLPQPGGRYYVLDGRHRVQAHKLVGLRKILIRYGEPT